MVASLSTSPDKKALKVKVYKADKKRKSDILAPSQQQQPQLAVTSSGNSTTTLQKALIEREFDRKAMAAQKQSQTNSPAKSRQKVKDKQILHSKTCSQGFL